MIMFIFQFEVEKKSIKKITKGRCQDIRHLFGEMSHFSFVYGIVVFSLDTIIFVMGIIYGFGEILGMNVYKVNLFDVLIIIILMFTFLYFSFHIYINPQNYLLNDIQQRIQFYGACGTTLSFLMLLIGEDRYFKILLSGVLLLFAWLQYLITKEKNAIEKMGRVYSIQRFN